MKAATLCFFRCFRVAAISIHAAREGGDPVIIALYNDVFISIHAAREGGDFRKLAVRCDRKISIHAAREGGDAVRIIIQHSAALISIHAAREGGDVIFLCANTCRIGFQSTPPVKAATHTG